MTDFEELHRWSVEQELRDSLAADSMRALRVKVAAMQENRALTVWTGGLGFPSSNAMRAFNQQTAAMRAGYESYNDLMAAAAGQPHFRYADASRAGLFSGFDAFFT